MKKKPPDDDFYKKRIRNVDDEVGCSVLNFSDDATIRIWPYKRSTWRCVISSILTFVTVGFLRLVFYWKPEWQVRFMFDSCPLNEADCVLIKDENFQWFLRFVRRATPKSLTDVGGFTIMDSGGVALTVQSYRYFTFQKVFFVWDENSQNFRRLSSFDDNVPICAYHRCQQLTNDEATRRFAVYGSNEIVVKLKPLIYLLFFEVLSPFYAFQAFSILMWCLDYYYFYSSIIAFVSIVTITIDVYQIQKNQKSLKDAIASSDVVTLVRDGQPPQVVPSTCLVIGDVIHIPLHGCEMQCDAVLLTGTCIVNESMLTGESVPVTKTQMPFAADDEETYDYKKHAKHTLFNGTRILQTRYYSGQAVRAVVIRTGYNTLKGQLVRSIMYPKPVDFEFTKDLLRFVLVLAVIAVAGFIYSTVIMTVHDIDAGRIIIDSLNVICTVVPAALPAAMTIGIMVAKSRIQKRQIFCISPSTINTCGAVNAVCFDKTGTLTEGGLDLYGIMPSEKNLLIGPILTPSHLGESSELVHALVCCHSLAVVNNELVGDPLDLILFRETGWILEEPNVVEETARFDMLAPTVVRPANQTSTIEIGILRQFTFSSSLQRMSVMARVLGSPNLLLYCKGAPETIYSLCTQESLPENFTEVLQEYAKKGFRVLGVAHRMLDMNFVKAQRVSREEVEIELEFLGLVILENRLKAETTPAIRQLKQADMRTMMVTGDNILTAISVARECGILDDVRPLYIVESSSSPPSIKVHVENGSTPQNDAANLFISKDKLISFECDQEDGGNFFKPATSNYQLSISGPSFAVMTKYFAHLVPQLVSVCDIYARMAPDQKAQIVHALQDLDYVVAMCGDGANDCGALKAAHVGVSLSDTEASIASPFTSKRDDISCIPILVREGRAALVTSFGVFKFMAAYSLNIFMTGCILQWIGSDLADLQYLYIDLFLISAVAVFFGWTPASNVLTVRRPPTKILSLPSVLSIFLQLFVFTAFQVFTFKFIEFQPWFIPFVNPQYEASPNSYQTTAVFYMSVFQYNIMTVIYSKSYPYRKSLFYNRYLFVWLFFSTTISVWLCVNPPNFVVDYLILKMPPAIKYRVLMVFMGALNFLMSCFLEWFIIDGILMKFVDENGRCKGSTLPKYAKMLQEIGLDIAWLHSPTATCGEVDDDTNPKSFPSPTPSDVSNNNIEQCNLPNVSSVNGIMLISIK